MGNAEAKEDGSLDIEFPSPYLSLFGPNNIIGRSIVIHAKSIMYSRFPDIQPSPTEGQQDFPIPVQTEEQKVGAILACGMITIKKNWSVHIEIAKLPVENLCQINTHIFPCTLTDNYVLQPFVCKLCAISVSQTCFVRLSMTHRCYSDFSSSIKGEQKKGKKEKGIIAWVMYYLYKSQ